MAANKNTFTITCSLLLVLLVDTSHGFSSADFTSGGSADSACNQRFPSGHGPSGQTTSAPYEMTLSSPTYSEGSLITVTISVGSGTSFKGFLVQAVQETNDDKVGEMEVVDTANSKLNCPNNGGKTITHTSPSDKTNITFNWKAPLTDVGNVLFKYTMVETRSIFWVNVTSSTLTFVATTGTIPTAAPTTPEPTMDPDTTPQMEDVPEIDVTDCGVHKSCFRNPKSCGGRDCKFLVTWARDGEGHLKFEVQGNAGPEIGYIAIGFSEDSSMGDDSVIDCIYTGASDKPVDVQMSRNPGRFNTVLDNKYLGLVEAKSHGFYGDGRITCRFTRLVKPEDPSSTDADKVFDLGARSYHLLMAKGSADNGAKRQHEFENRLASPEFYNFTDAPLDVGGASGPAALIKTHAICMILAWMVSASIAVLMPRYGKQAWPDKRWCGKHVWYHIHMPLMVCTFFLTIIGFVIIFVEVGGYAQYTTLPAMAHPILGIITTALVVLNPIMAAFRPDPGARRRPIFNWCHFAVGFCAHAISIATIFIGLYLPKSHAPPYSVWIMVAFICWQVLIEICLSIHMRCCIKDQSSEKYEMSNRGGGNVETTHADGSGWKTFFMLLHLFGVLALALALIIPIARASGE